MSASPRFPNGNYQKQAFSFRGEDPLKEQEYLKDQYKRALAEFRIASQEVESLDEQIRQEEEVLEEAQGFTYALSEAIDGKTDSGQQNIQLKKDLVNLESIITEKEHELNSVKATQNNLYIAAMNKEKSTLLLVIDRLHHIISSGNDSDESAVGAIARIQSSDAFRATCEKEIDLLLEQRKGSYLKRELSDVKQLFDRGEKIVPLRTNEAAQQRSLMSDLSELKAETQRISLMLKENTEKHNMRIEMLLYIINELNLSMFGLDVPKESFVDINALKEKLNLKTQEQLQTERDDRHVLRDERRQNKQKRHEEILRTDIREQILEKRKQKRMKDEKDRKEREIIAEIAAKRNQEFQERLKLAREEMERKEAEKIKAPPKTAQYRSPRTIKQTQANTNHSPGKIAQELNTPETPQQSNEKQITKPNTTDTPYPTKNKPKQNKKEVVSTSHKEIIEPLTKTNNNTNNKEGKPIVTLDKDTAQKETESFSCIELVTNQNENSKNQQKEFIIEEEKQIDDFGDESFKNEFAQKEGLSIETPSEKNEELQPSSEKDANINIANGKFEELLKNLDLNDDDPEKKQDAPVLPIDGNLQELNNQPKVITDNSIPEKDIKTTSDQKPALNETNEANDDDLDAFLSESSNSKIVLLDSKDDEENDFEADDFLVSSQRQSEKQSINPKNDADDFEDDFET